jgi:Protein of unknown function (DUF3987)
MKSTTDFLKAIGHKDRVYIRCLPPKNIPLPELQVRGMTYPNKDGEIKRSIIQGYINLDSGEFCQIYGDKHQPKSFPDGWGYFDALNGQGYGIYFVVHHGGDKNSQITHGSALFHESDRASFEEQQQEIDRITDEFGKPTAVVKTRKSLHAYWASSENIEIDRLATYQRRWIQYSTCDDDSLADPAQLMRLPDFDHLSWNAETQEFDRIPCELSQLNDVRYSIAEFDRVLPDLDLDRWTRKSIREIEASDPSPMDIRSFASYLEGYQEDGRQRWITCKCPAHNGESDDSLHIDRATGGFVCHGGCPSPAIYNSAKTKAINQGYRLEVASQASEDLNRLLTKSEYDPASALPDVLKGLIEAEAIRWSLPSLVYVAPLLAVVLSLSKVEATLNVRETRGKPILWVGIVGTSNSGKSEVLKTITSPLTALQKGANEEYTLAVGDYERQLAEYEQKKRKKEDLGDKPNSPACREFYVDDYTYESLAYISQFQKLQCLLLKIDELKGFTDFDKYGTANNRSRILSLYDGDEMKVNRKSSPRIHIEKTGISLVGTTQYTTLSRIFEQDDNKEDGLWARVVFVSLPTTATYSHDPDSNHSLYDALAKIYANINDFTAQTFTASSEAQKLWSDWYNDMVDRTIEQSGTFLESIYGKAKDRIARLALALHLLAAAAEDKQPNREVSASTMYHAIELGRCLLLETEKVLALTGSNPTTDPADARILKFINRFAGKGLITTRMVTHWWSGKSKPSAKDIRAFMLKVVELGYASENDESKRQFSDYKIEILEKPSNSSNKKPETSVLQRKTLLLENESSSNGLVTTALQNITESLQDNGLDTAIQSSNNVESAQAEGYSHCPAAIVTNQLLEQELDSNSLEPLCSKNLSIPVTKVTKDSQISQSKQDDLLAEINIDIIPPATEEDF